MDLRGCSIVPESMFICARIRVQRLQNQCSKRPEWVFNWNQNRRSSDARIDVHAEPEWVFKLGRNTQFQKKLLMRQYFYLLEWKMTFVWYA